MLESLKIIGRVRPLLVIHRFQALLVRAVANGNETVPTLRVGDAWLVNPSADEVEPLARP